MKFKGGLAVLLVVSALALALTPCAFAFSGAYTDSAESQTIDTQYTRVSVVDSVGNPVSAITCSSLGAVKTTSGYKVAELDLSEGAFLLATGTDVKLGEITATITGNPFAVKCALSPYTEGSEPSYSYKAISGTPTVLKCDASIGQKMWISTIMEAGIIGADVESVQMDLTFSITLVHTGTHQTEQVMTVIHIDDIVTPKGDADVRSGADAEGHATIRVYTTQDDDDSVITGSSIKKSATIDVADGQEFCLQYILYDGLIGSYLDAKGENIYFVAHWTDSTGAHSATSDTINGKGTNPWNHKQGYFGLVNGTLVHFDTVAELDSAGAWIQGTNVSIEIWGNISNYNDHPFGIDSFGHVFGAVVLK